MSEEAINISWRAPSNIALVKYWGKRDHQLPDNGSLSLTLEYSSTTTSLSFRKKNIKEKKIQLKYFFQDKKNRKFEEKIERLLNHLSSEMPFLTDFELEFHSSNNFPHSTGIASSASSMGALALCLVTMEEIVNQKKLSKEDFSRRASSIARLGSGSASRSVFGGVVTWGEIPSVDHSSDEYATPIPLPKGSRLNQLRDAILIVSTKEKTISSTSGHALMKDHPYKEGRKSQANSNLLKMIGAIRNDDYQTIAAIAENEAMSLHAILMTSSPDGLLMNANTLRLIEEIKQFRTKTVINLFFTIDAGPNLHLIYFEDQRELVIPFIEKSLLPFCEDGQWIDDKLGSGPIQL